MLYERWTAFEGNDLLQRRQYLLASVSGSAAGFTGSNDDETLGTPKAKGDRTVTSANNRFVAAVGGNTLTSTLVLDRMQRRVSTPGNIIPTLKRLLPGVKIPASVNRELRKQKDLAATLFQSLAAGSESGEGDKRCTPKGKSSDIGYLRVDSPVGGKKINLTYGDVNGQDAMQVLAYRYLACRGYGAFCLD